MTTADEGPAGRLTASEVASQPECWARAIDLALGTSGPAGWVAAAGCGTSYYILDAWAVLREKSGAGATDAYLASRVPTRPFDRLLVLSRSGTTGDVLDLLAEPRHRDVCRVAIVGVAQSPAAALADVVVDLGFADEESVVQTRFATTALTWLRATLGQDMRPLTEQARQVLAEPSPVPPSARHLVFLGHGWAAAMAHEAALKVREGAQIFAESYPAEEYLHGPIALAEPGTYVWALGRLDERIAQAVTATGAHLVDLGRDPQVELVAVHQFMLAAAADRGLDPDHPRHLFRSVT